MPIPIRDAFIDVYTGEPTEQSLSELDPDYTIPAGDIEEIQIAARTDEVMDRVDLSLHNHGGKYTETHNLDTADRIRFTAPMGQTIPYGNGLYGGGIYGGSFSISWTGRITGGSTTRSSPDLGYVDFKARDYVGDVLSNRKLTNSYIDEDVGAIIRDIGRRKAPEVDMSNIPDFGVTTDIKYTQADCWDAVLGLAARADAVTIPDHDRLQINPIHELPYSFDLGPNDYFLPFEAERDDNVKNVVRVDSGENRKLEEEQPVVSDGNEIYVNDTQRVTHRLRARKAEVQSIELFVLRGDADESLKVRLQSDQGGSPVAIEDEDSDIANTQWESDNLPASAWKTFFFPDHTLADRDPWLIIEGGGETGHEVGADADGDLAFRSFYPHPLNFEVQDNDSIAEYGHREVQLDRPNLKTLAATRDAARAELARRGWPSKSVSFEVASDRGHMLAPGDRFDIHEPREAVTGEHITSEVVTTWSSDEMFLKTDITAQWRKGVLAPQG